MQISTDVSKIADCIKLGGVVAYPTEAVFGLGCDPNNQQAVERLLKVKQRKVEKGLILIASNLEQAEPYVLPLDDATKNRLNETWPGAVTWLIPSSDKAPQWITGIHTSLAIRVSAHPVCQQLCQLCQYPVVSTSANPATEPPARSLEEVKQYFDGQIDMVLDSPLGGNTLPSEIRDSHTGDIIRAG